MRFNLDMARQYAEVLTGGGSALTWAVLPEKGANSPVNNAHYYGSVDEHLEALTWVQENRGGVFALVNEGDGSTRRTKDTIIRCRAVWLEVDSQHLPDLPLEPSLLVKTRNGYHCYWRTDNLPLLECRAMNERIIYHCGGDPNARDICRVLRVPGFFHQKNGADPVMVTLVRWSDDVFAAGELREAFPEYEGHRPPHEAEYESAPADLDRLNPHVRTLVEQHAEILAGTPPGQAGGRNGALNLYAFRLGQLGPSHLGDDIALELARGACQANGLIAEYGEESFRKTFMSGWAAGRKDPRGVPTIDAHGKPFGSFGTGQPAPTELQELHISKGNRQSVTKFFEDIAEKGLEPIPLPLDDANALLNGGVHPGGGFVLLQAAPGHGKSTLALRTALDEVDRGGPALIVSLEMPVSQVVARLVSMLYDVNWSDVELGRHNDLVQRAFDLFETRPLYLVDYKRCSSVPQIEQCVAIVAKEYGKAPLTIVDYVQLLTKPDSQGTFRASAHETSLALSRLCKGENVPMICISSVGRGAYNIINKQTQEPVYSLVMSAAKESGQFEFDAKMVLGVQLYEPLSLGADQYGWLCVAKNRSAGTVGNVAFRYQGLRGGYEQVTKAELKEAMDSGSDVNAEQEICAAILRNNTLRTYEDVRQEAGKKKSVINRIMKKLIEQGRVSTRVDHTYQVHDL